MKRKDVIEGGKYWWITRDQWVTVFVCSSRGSGLLAIKDVVGQIHWIHADELRQDEPKRAGAATKSEPAEKPKTKLEALAEDWPAQRAKLFPECYPNGLPKMRRGRL